MSWSQGAVRQKNVLFLPITAISPNPAHPRVTCPPELANSVALYGILQPLSVRQKENRWELVAGHRRLQAAKLAGLKQVPCRIAAEDDRLTALLEELGRKDIPYIRQARLLQQLTDACRLSQDAAAAHLGLSQSAVANKLRLLHHPPEILALLEHSRLTERHARALLREPDLTRRKALLLQADAGGWTVARLEAELTARPSLPTPLEQALAAVRALGLTATQSLCHTDTEFILTIRLPKATA